MKKLLYLLCILFIFSIIASLTNPPKVKELQTNDYLLSYKSVLSHLDRVYGLFTELEYKRISEIYGVYEVPELTHRKRLLIKRSTYPFKKYIYQTAPYEKEPLLNLSNQTQVLNWLTNNTGMRGEFKHLRIYPNNYVSEAIRYINPQMERIYLENLKTQKEYTDWANKNGSLSNTPQPLYPGQSITVDGKTFTMQNYFDDGRRAQWIKESGEKINAALERELAIAINIKAKTQPFFDRDANVDTFFIDSNFFEGGQGNVSTNRLATKEKIDGIKAEQKNIRDDLFNSGFVVEMERQLNTIKKLEPVSVNYIKEVKKYSLDNFKFFAASLNYRTVDAFIASYKNTILGWTGKSNDLSATYSFAFREKLNINTDGLNKINLLSHYFIKFGSILPYLFLILTIYTIRIIWRKTKP